VVSFGVGMLAPEPVCRRRSGRSGLGTIRGNSKRQSRRRRGYIHALRANPGAEGPVLLRTRSPCLSLVLASFLSSRSFSFFSNFCLLRSAISGC
jgi:hypothetical protein